MKNEELIELIDAKFTALRAELKASCDILDIVHQDVKRINGSVRILQDRSVQRGVYWRWAIPGGIILFIILFLIVEISGLDELLKMIL